MIVIGKFQINSLVQSKVSSYVGSDSTGKHQYKRSRSCRIQCTGVKSVPFGDATPDAQLNMHIQNPAAARVFVDSWNEYLEGDELNVPNFYAAFMTPDDYERFLAWIEGGKATAPEAMLPDAPAETVVH